MQGLGSALAEADAADNSTAQIQTPALAAENDDWLLNEQLRSLKQRLNLSVVPSTSIPPVMPPLPAPAAVTAATQQNRSSDCRRRSSIVAWGMMSLGLMSFVCGAVLLAWSFVGHRSDLWNIGMPLTLVGQFGLLVGLALQLDHLWHANRRTTETLENVDRQLLEINHTATMLRTSHASPGQSFYAHLAEGAHPHLLLSDLKGQLDLLANKLSQQR